MITRRLWFALGSLLAIGCEAASPDSAPARTPVRAPASPAQVEPATYEATGCDSQEAFYRQAVVATMRRSFEQVRSRYLDVPPSGGEVLVEGELPRHARLYALPPPDALVSSPRRWLLDGALLYGSSTDFGPLHVVDLGSSTPTTVASKEPVVGGFPVARAGTMLVTALETRRETELPGAPVASGPGVYDVVDPCTLGYNCQVAAPVETAVTLSLIDVSDPSSPLLRRSVTVPGRFVHAQVTGSKVQVVMRHDGASWPWMNWNFPDFDRDDPVARATFSQSLDEMGATIEQKIASTEVRGLLPWIEEDGQRQLACGTMRRSAKIEEVGSTTLLTLSLDDAPIESHTVLGRLDQIAASDDRITVLDLHRRPTWFDLPPDVPFSEAFSFAVSDASPSVSSRWFAEVPGAIMGAAAVQERDGALAVLSSTSPDPGSMVTSRAVASQPASHLRNLLTEGIRAAQFEPQGHRLLVSSWDQTSSFVALLDPRKEGSAQLVGRAAIGEDMRYVRWLDASHALTLVAQPDPGSLGPSRVVMQVRDLSSPALPVTQELLVADGATRRGLEMENPRNEPFARTEPFVRFFPDATGGWIVLPTATAVACPTRVDREEMAVFRVENDGRILAREPMILSHPDCATGAPLFVSPNRAVSVRDGQLSVLTDDTITVRSLTSVTASDRVISLAGL